MSKRLIVLVFLLFMLIPIVARGQNAYDPITLDDVDDLHMTGIVTRGGISSFSWSHDSKKIVVASYGGLWIYDPLDFDIPPQRYSTDGYGTVMYSDDGHYLATGTTTSASQTQCGGIYGHDNLTVWDLETNKTVVDASVSVVNMRFIPGHDLLLTVNDRSGLEIWDLNTGEQIAYSQYLIPEVASHSFGSSIVLTVSPDGAYFGATSVYGGGEPYRWSNEPLIELFLQTDRELDIFATRNVVETGSFEHVEVSVSDDWITRDGLSPDGLFQARFVGGLLAIYDADTGDERSVLEAHPSGFSTFAFHPDGNEVAYLMYSNEIRLWDVENLQITRTIAIDDVISGSRLLYSPDGQILTWASTNSPDMIYIWDVNSDDSPSVIESSRSYGVSPQQFSSDGHTLFAVSNDRFLLIDIFNQETIVNVEIDRRPRTTAFSEDNRFVAVYLPIDINGEIQIWRVDDLVSGDYIEQKYAVDFAVSRMAFVSNDTLLLERLIDDCTMTVSLFDMLTGIETRLDSNLEQADGISLYSPTLNADRNLVAAASPSGIRFWDLQTLDEVAKIPGAFSSIAFSRDGRTLLVRSDVFQIWHVSSSEE